MPIFSVCLSRGHSLELSKLPPSVCVPTAAACWWETRAKFGSSLSGVPIYACTLHHVEQGSNKWRENCTKKLRELLAWGRQILYSTVTTSHIHSYSLTNGYIFNKSYTLNPYISSYPIILHIYSQKRQRHHWLHAHAHAHIHTDTHTHT